jgi:2-polyprenyl-6-methoxyphenol hydroxylase-like FAD-dependent oxidoreductase
MTLAMALRRRGVEVRIVDKAASRTDKSKALVVWPRTLELLDIEGCAQPFIDAGMQAKGARITAHGKMLVHVAFDIARSVYRYGLMIPQSDTERLLEAQLSALGVTVERQVTLASFVAGADGVSAVLQHADGRNETVQASYLAGCDGAHSTVRHALNAQFEGDTMPSGWALADVQLDGDIPRDELTVCWTPDGVLVFFPITPTRFRVIADVDLPGTGEPPPLALDEIQAVLKDRGPPGLRAHDPVWLSRFRINERKVRDYRDGRVFLLGDAAHVHSPAGGQGMNTGMQDAFNLAWKLAMVWHRKAAPALLDSYSPERSAIGEQVLQAAGTMTKVAILRNPVLQEIRNLVAGTLGHLPALQQKIVDQMTEVSLHYRDSPLTQALHGASRHPGGGERAPDLPITLTGNGTVRLHELLRTGKFVVLSVGTPRVELPTAVEGIAATASVVSDPHYAAGHIYLIRPDAYVALSTDGGGAGTVIKALVRIAA